MSVSVSQGVRLLADVDGLSSLQITIPAWSILRAFGIDVTAVNQDLTIMFAIMIFLLIVICILVAYRIRERR